MEKWTEDRVKTLVLLRGQGLSCLAIARKLGRDFTRNMVVGKLARLGVKPVRTIRVKPVSGVIVWTKQPKAKKAKPAPFTPTITVASYDDVVNADGCRFIGGDPHDGTAVYCGHTRRPGSLYCDGHYATCFRGKGGRL
jgi:hypothetical protein